MDALDKIKSFDSLNELIIEIERDLNTRDMLARRYGVRFIMLNNFEVFRNLSITMSNFGIKSLHLEELIAEDKDGNITPDMLKEAIAGCKESTFVTPFSELVRFYNDDEFRGFFNEISLLEDIEHPEKRIYIPLIGLQNRFTNFLQSFGRIEESAPVWKCEQEEHKTLVYVTKYRGYELPELNNQIQLKTLYDWLRFWKKEAPQEKIICSSRQVSRLHKNSRPDNSFTFKPIDSAYNFITEFLNIHTPIVYNKEDDKYWDDFLKEVKGLEDTDFEFETFVKHRFNKMSFSSNDFVELWAVHDLKAYDRWLMKHFAENSDVFANNPYLRKCISEEDELRTPESLFIRIAERILFDMEPQHRNAFAEERGDIMRSNADLFREYVPNSKQDWMQQRIMEIVKVQQDFKTALKMCTSTFYFEKKLYLGWYVARSEKDFGLKKLEQYYPEAYHYLSMALPDNIKSNQRWCLDYIQAYKDAKVKDKLTENVTNCIKCNNANADAFYDWYYSFSESHEKLASTNNNPLQKADKVYWIDALGMEYLSLIRWQIEENENSNFHLVQADVTRTNVPSSTSLNRFDNITKKIPELDQLGHDSGHYQRLDTLVREIELVKNKIHEIISDNQKEKCTIAIVSDHGLSALSRLAPSIKYDSPTEHEGRYIKIESKKEHDTDYICHQNETDGNWYKVALTHSSLGNKPTHEVHGGCLPEEVLVPFVIISNKDDKHIDYTMKLQNDHIAVSEGEISVAIMPEPDSVKLLYENQPIDMIREGTTWKAKIVNPQPGKHTITIMPSNGKNKNMDMEFYGLSFGNITDDFDI